MKVLKRTKTATQSACVGASSVRVIFNLSALHRTRVHFQRCAIGGTTLIKFLSKVFEISKQVATHMVSREISYFKYFESRALSNASLKIEVLWHQFSASHDHRWVSRTVIWISVALMRIHIKYTPIREGARLTCLSRDCAEI